MCEYILINKNGRALMRERAGEKIARNCDLLREEAKRKRCTRIRFAVMFTPERETLVQTKKRRIGNENNRIKALYRLSVISRCFFFFFLVDPPII